MKFKSIILTGLLSVFYPFARVLKVQKNRITFMSLEHDYLSKDFKRLHEELSRTADYELRTILFKYEPTIWGNLRYCVACVRQLFYVQTSGLVIIDYNNFVVSRFPHRDTVKVLQVWHATGALKKFGNAVPRAYKIKNYDYAIVNSAFFKPIFGQAFDLQEDRIIVTGIPNNDQNFDTDMVAQKRHRLRQKYQLPEGKTVITYAPTFRGQMGTTFEEINVDLSRICDELGEDYILLYKAHPLITNSHFEANPNIIFVEDELISSLFCVTDLLISDYSSLTIDWMLFDKPTIAYVPDLVTYEAQTGLTIDYLQDFPGTVVQDEAQLSREILQMTTEKDALKRQLFREKMYQYQDGHATQRVTHLIEQIMNDTQ